MNCQRCCKLEEAIYRVHSDLIDMKVCAACADEARRLGIAVEKTMERRGSLNLAITNQNSCFIAGSEDNKTSLVLK